MQVSFVHRTAACTGRFIKCLVLQHKNDYNLVISKDKIIYIYNSIRISYRGATMLDFRIETFLAVCRYMNFTKAAEALSITQPAVSQHIHYLEKEYDTKLFFYEGKKLSLTKEGSILLTSMQQMKNDEEELKTKLKESTADTQTLSFGVTMTIGEYAVVEPLKKYLKTHPDTNVHVHYGNTSVLLDKLHNGLIDFALVEGYFSGEEYATEVFSTEAFVAVCSYDHTFRKDPKKLHDLFKERLLVREEGSGTRNILERSLALQNYTIADFSHYAEIENMHTINKLLLADCGISFLYRTAVSDNLERKELREIKLSDFKMQHDFTFLWEKSSIFSDTIRQTCLELKSCKKD